ncbi:MAG: type II secretion system F family protein [Eubacteriales bacterium]|nr:type II secretion system F family protein [Eubacteriales bacterium]
MIRTLVTVAFIIAFYFIFYLFAMARTKEKKKMDERVRALFDLSADESANRRAGQKKQRKNPLRLEQIADELYVAGVVLRAEEFVTIWILLGAVIPAIALFLGAPTTICIGLVIVGVAAPITWVTIKKNKRLAVLASQLSDALTIICNALRVGQSFQYALKSVADEMEEPISREFMRVYRETQYGMPLETSLGRLVGRTRNPDLELMSSAVIIQRQIGGNLAIILQNISDTINQRVQIRGEIHTMTSAGRMSGYIIGALPAFIILLLMFINPGYIDMFFTTEKGRIMMVISLVLEAIGFSIVNKIVNIKV